MKLYKSMYNKTVPTIFTAIALLYYTATSMKTILIRSIRQRIYSCIVIIAVVLSRFQLTTYLHNGTTYILVVTTFDSKIQGAFSVFVTGPNSVSVNRTSEFFYFS